MEEGENKAGRPKARFELTEGWAKAILDLYEVGASDVEIKAWIYTDRGTFSNDLWERWIEEEPQFSETIKIGRILSETWWSKQGRTNLKTKDFNFVGWYMNMKNRFGWKDRQEIKHEGNLTGFLSIDPLDDSADQSPSKDSGTKET